MAFFTVIGIGMCVPEKILSNEELESRGIGASATWIYENIGVKERRIASSTQVCSDLAASAAEEALKNAGIGADEVDLIVMSTVTPDYIVPGTSAVVKQKINACNAMCYDILSGCAGFVCSLINGVGYAMLNEDIRTILVIGSDVISKITDWNNHKACSGMGEGAGAFVLQDNECSSSIKSSYIYHQTMKSLNCGYIPILQGEINQESKVNYIFEGRYLYDRLLESIPFIVNKLLRKSRWKIDDVSLFIFSQINKSLIYDVARILNVPYEKAYTVMERYGYTSNGSIPIAVHEAYINNRLCKGDKVILVAGGAGISCAGIALEWTL